jgi:hypothetical protein
MKCCNSRERARGQHCAKDSSRSVHSGSCAASSLAAANSSLAGCDRGSLPFVCNKKCKVANGKAVGQGLRSSPDAWPSLDLGGNLAAGRTVRVGTQHLAYLPFEVPILFFLCRAEQPYAPKKESEPANGMRIICRLYLSHQRRSRVSRSDTKPVSRARQCPDPGGETRLTR